MRRVMIGAVAVLGVAGCGSDEASSPTSQPAASVQAATTIAPAVTLTVAAVDPTEAPAPAPSPAPPQDSTTLVESTVPQTTAASSLALLTDCSVAALTAAIGPANAGFAYQQVLCVTAADGVRYLTWWQIPQDAAAGDGAQTLGVIKGAGLEILNAGTADVCVGLAPPELFDALSCS